MWKNALHNILKLKVNSSSCFPLSNQHSNDEDEQHNPYIFFEAENQQMVTELSRRNHHSNLTIFYINYYNL